MECVSKLARQMTSFPRSTVIACNHTIATFTGAAQSLRTDGEAPPPWLVVRRAYSASERRLPGGDRRSYSLATAAPNSASWPFCDTSVATSIPPLSLRRTMKNQPRNTDTHKSQCPGVAKWATTEADPVAPALASRPAHHQTAIQALPKTIGLPA
jgi:hypothetical protein